MADHANEPIPRRSTAPTRFAESLVARLPVESPTTVARHRLRVVLEQCGYRRSGSLALGTIQTAIEAAGIFAAPRLTDSGLGRDTVIEFSRVPRLSPRPGLLLPSEFSLEAFICANYRQIAGLGHLKQPRPQYRLPSGNRIDILFGVRGSDALVVTELKNDAIDRGTVAQVFDYAEELRSTPLGAGTPVKVLIISGSPMTSLEDDAEAQSDRHGIPVQWLCYRVEMTVQSTLSHEPTGAGTR